MVAREVMVDVMWKVLQKEEVEVSEEEVEEDGDGERRIKEGEDKRGGRWEGK